MMQINFSIGQLNMRHLMRMLHLSIIISIFLFLNPSAMANYMYIKPGQSKTIDSNADIDTAFVSNPAVADYKILSERRIVVYGKSNGLSEITLYGADAKVISKVTIEVDPVISDLAYRIKTAFPNTNVRIQRLAESGAANGGKASYLLTGQVPDEETADLIYIIVGEVVGADRKEEVLTFDTTGTDADNSTGGSTTSNKIEHMTKVRYSNIIQKFTFPRQRSNQVNVQLVLVEVSKEFTDAIGIEWSNLKFNDSSSTNSPGHFQLLNFKGLDSANIVNTINLVKDDSVARVLANPNLTVLSGEQAQFLVGGEVPITIRDTNNNSVSTSYKAHGIMLSIAPKVLKDDKIKLTLATELSSASQTNTAEATPTFNTRRSVSTIELANGQTFVIGGLLKEEDSEILQKIPFFGDIPILGALARNTNTRRQKTELVIFATVNLVNPLDSVSEVNTPFSGTKSSSENLFFNVGIDKALRENRLLGNKSKQIDSKTVSFLDRGGFDK